MVLATRQGYSVDVESHEKVGNWRPSTLKLLDSELQFLRLLIDCELLFAHLLHMGSSVGCHVAAVIIHKERNAITINTFASWNVTFKMWLSSSSLTVGFASKVLAREWWRHWIRNVAFAQNSCEALKKGKRLKLEVPSQIFRSQAVASRDSIFSKFTTDNVWTWDTARAESISKK